MREIENKIINEATELNACNLLKRGMKADELLALAFNPQGWEFCRKHSFPCIEDVRALYGLKQPNNGAYAVIIDGCTQFEAGRCRNILVAGEGETNIICEDGEDTYHILLFHGARVTVYASNYAVVHVEKVGRGCHVNFINLDNKSVLL